MNVAVGSAGSSLQAWKPVIALAILATFAALGLSAAWLTLHTSWASVTGAYPHGYLILGMSVWLGVRSWRLARPLALRPYWWAAIPLAACVLALWLMEVLLIDTSRLIVLPPLLLCAVALVFGKAAARALAWPIGFLYFALPQWWLLNGLLQRLTTAAVTLMIDLTGLPAYVEGNFIHVPEGVFEVASGCAGLNYVVVAAALAVFYGLMYLSDTRSCLKLTALAAVLAIVCNWLRVFVLVLIGIFSDMQHYLIRVDHIAFGWVMFLVFMVPLQVYAMRLESKQGELDSSHEPADAGTASSMVIAGPIAAAALVAGVILLAPRGLHWSSAFESADLRPLPETMLAGAGRVPPDRSWAPRFINAEEERAAYRADDQTIEVYRGFYQEQTFEQRLIRRDNSFFGEGWRSVEEREARVIAGDARFTVREYLGYLNGRRQVLWGWYWVAGRPAHSELGAKLLQLRGILEARSDALAIALATDCIPSCQAASERLGAFVQGAIGPLSGQSGFSLRSETPPKRVEEQLRGEG